MNLTIMDMSEEELEIEVNKAKEIIISKFESEGKSYRYFLDRACGYFALMLYNIFKGRATIYDCQFHAVCKIGEKYYDANFGDVTASVLYGEDKFSADDLNTKEGEAYFGLFMDMCRYGWSKEQIESEDAHMKELENYAKKVLGYEYEASLDK